MKCIESRVIMHIYSELHVFNVYIYIYIYILRQEQSPCGAIFDEIRFPSAMPFASAPL